MARAGTVRLPATVGVPFGTLVIPAASTGTGSRRCSRRRQRHRRQIRAAGRAAHSQPQGDLHEVAGLGVVAQTDHVAELVLEHRQEIDFCWLPGFPAPRANRRPDPAGPKGRARSAAAFLGTSCNPRPSG